MSNALSPSDGENRASIVAARRFFLLFVYLLAYLIVDPYLENTGAGYVLVRVAGSVGIFIVLYAISRRRTILFVGIALAIPALLQLLLQFRADAGTLSVINIVLSFSFDVFVVVVIFRRVIMEEQPTAETIFGALCIYLLVGFTFASVYGMIATLQPRAFYLDPMVNTHVTPDRFDFIYYSFATMTSVGASGIVPASRQARSVTIIEATLGVLYLAVLIARLIGSYKRPLAARGD